MIKAQPLPFRNPIFCAIDRPDVAGTVALARALADTVGGIKLGLEFFTANGPAGVRAATALGLPLFLDLKLHDIPSTVAGAVRSALALRPAMLTLHAAGGRGMLEAAVDAAGSGQRPWLLAITVLTSLDAGDLRATGIDAAPADQALRLADLAISAGVDGVVCSPHEIEALRARFGRDLRLVVPGIRADGDRGSDQKRTMPAAEAVARGADVVVIGRPITRAASPRDAAMALAQSLPAAA
jgi:orotidine-5'-phosphate decarboxylase